MEELPAIKVRNIRAGGFGTALFGAILASAGFTAHAPQPHPIWFWRYVGILGLGIILSGFLIASRWAGARYVATVFVGTFAASLAVGGLVRVRMLTMPQIALVAIVCYVCARGVLYLHGQEGRAYFADRQDRKE